MSLESKIRREHILWIDDKWDCKRAYDIWESKKDLNESIRGWEYRNMR